MIYRNSFALLALTAALCSPAQAHVTLEQSTATAGSPYKAVFRVGHGCAGSPTTGITVFLPPGFTDAKPMPKPGWQLGIQREPLTVPYTSHGNTVSDRAAVIHWEGGRLADAEYDEFVLRGTLPATTGKLYFRVLQTCAEGSNDWAAIQTGSDRPAFPAAVLELTPADKTPAHQH
ncbi:YcnI family protein [Uliginosibacterium paludis]|uniref:YcnI family protein n=1 Tax=Uliginosibacterium paludis TaxID=1615952 RepID=A0ABV2CPP3_9RHOO